MPWCRDLCAFEDQAAIDTLHWPDGVARLEFKTRESGATMGENSKHSTHNIDMAVGPEEGGKLAQGRIQSASQCAPKCAGKRSRLMEPHGGYAREALAGAKRPFFLYRPKVLGEASRT
jgi:hypothetical protein